MINSVTGTVSTIAGNNNYAYSGDGGPAINAELFDPSAITFDPAGNLYISQYDDSRIRMISAATGIINTIAGNGINAFAGDGGPAQLGSLNNPRQLAHDGAGNLYIADSYNHRIRKVGVETSPPPVLPTTISIAASTTVACQGYPVTFTAGAVNPGFNAIYQWKVNGNPVNVIQPEFTTSILKDGDVVSFTLLAIVCGQNLQINSNGIKMSVVSGQPPSVVIRASDTAVCTGSNVVFSASIQNIVNPVYQWKRNGTNAGTNSNTYTTNALVNGDTITCEVSSTGTGSCGSQGIITSNSIVMNVQSGQAATVTVTPSATEICRGAPVTFTAVTTNGGASLTYQWLLNGRNVGTNVNTYTNTNLADNDAVVCRVSSSGTACSTLPVNSPEVRVRIKPTPVITLFPKDTLVTPGTQVRLNASIAGQYAGYTWSPSTLLSSPASLTPVTVALNNSENFRLDVTGTEGCSATATASIRIFRKLFMPNAFTPNGDNVNDVFRIPPGVTITLYEFSVFDRWGNKLFTTTDITKGWNGVVKGTKSLSGVYMYLIRGADDKGSITEKGSFTLIR